jgi:hypothetical protein
MSFAYHGYRTRHIHCQQRETKYKTKIKQLQPVFTIHELIHQTLVTKTDADSLTVRLYLDPFKDLLQHHQGDHRQGEACPVRLAER